MYATLDILGREAIDPDIDAVIESFGQHHDIQTLVSEVRDKVSSHLVTLATKVNEVIGEFGDSYLSGVIKFWKINLEQAKTIVKAVPNTDGEKIDIGLEMQALEGKMEHGSISTENFYEECRSYRATLEKASSALDGVLGAFGKKMAESKEQLVEQMVKDGTYKRVDGRLSFSTGREVRVDSLSEDTKKALKDFHECLERCDYAGLAKNHCARKAAEKLSLLDQLPGKATVEEALKALELVERQMNRMMCFVEDLKKFVTSVSLFDHQAALDELAKNLESLGDQDAYRNSLLSMIRGHYQWRKDDIPGELIKSDEELDEMDAQALEQLINTISEKVMSRDLWIRSVICGKILDCFKSRRSFESRESSKAGSTFEISTFWYNGPLQLKIIDDRNYLAVNVSNRVESPYAPKK